MRRDQALWDARLCKETEGHRIVISVAVGSRHRVQRSCDYKPLTPFPLVGARADVGACSAQASRVISPLATGVVA